MSSSKMFTLSNGISLLRAPLALLFVVDNAPLRLFVIVLAMITDIVDGYLARKYRFTSRFGAILDPVMDKFFVFTTLCVLLVESRIHSWQVLSMVSRDIFLLFFGLYITLFKSLKSIKFRAIRWGKITTAMQFITLTALVQTLTVPLFTYGLFALFGLFAFIELLIGEAKCTAANP